MTERIDHVTAAEQIVHDAIYGTKLMEPELRTLLANDSWALTRKAVAALRAHGLLGGDPTEEQIERAAEALAAWDGFEWSGDWEGTVSRDAYRNGATRALSAAAGVAPQEPSEECTCPSGDGSLRWPCPSHPPAPQEPKWMRDNRQARGGFMAENSTYVRNDDREKLITEAAQKLDAWLTSQYDGNRNVPRIPFVRTLADTLAAQPVLDPASQEMIDNWLVVADHEAFNPCREAKEELSFVDHMLNRLTDLVSLEQTVNELAPAPVAVLDPEKAAEVVFNAANDEFLMMDEGEDWEVLASKGPDMAEPWRHVARALCEAAKRGALSA